MHVRFLLGPAGSGKTFRCLEEIRTALTRAPQGPPLIFLVPKQATFQIERQLLADPALPGYSRLRILSFERLASFVFDQVDGVVPRLLNEEGRIMVLRALLASHRDRLKVFRASARLPGFAQQLSQMLRELQQYRLDPARLEAVAPRVASVHRLGEKLHDLALVLRAYLEWLQTHDLQDGDGLLDLAGEALRAAWQRPGAFEVEGLWLDGFAQMTPQERRLLAALLPACRQSTLAFCLEEAPSGEPAWYSPWVLLSQTFRQCQTSVAAWPEAQVEVTLLARDPARSRFAGNAPLQHLETHWAQPCPWPTATPDSASQSPDPTCTDEGGLPAVRVVGCPHPEAEAIWAAREITRFVRQGGRYRDVAVLVRHLEPYHDPIRRIFSRYDIPFFLDRRESVSHHPLAELTRNALRTLAFHWRHDDWFGALKTGLVWSRMEDLDALENEALARGWEGHAWERDFQRPGSAEATARLNRLRARLVTPFVQLARATGDAPTGASLAAALQEFWRTLKVGATLERWSAGPGPEARSEDETSPVHTTVWDQMQLWLENVALAFPHEGRPLAEWLPILEAGLAGLTVGVIPPVLDAVLVGAIDRSRNPDLRRALVLGVNETVFPAPPPAPLLLTESDRNELEEVGCALGPGRRVQLGHERFYGYIACTRAREQVALTYAQRDARGRPLNPSGFIKHLQRLFPALEVETFAGLPSWPKAEHAGELVGPWLANQARPEAERDRALHQAGDWPVMRPLLEQLRHLQPACATPDLAPGLARALYGPVLRTSVSRLEQFAHCPFRFFVDSGLHLEERLKYELDLRLQGSFQHEVLAKFHEALQRENLRWRDLSVDQAQARIGHIADQLIPGFQEGMLLATGQNRFLAESYKASLQQFIAALIRWMAQYEFDPTAVEIGFGLPDEPLPAWEVPLNEQCRLSFVGRIDRVDLWREPGSEEAWCVVIDYKSGLRKPDAVLLRHGLQLQLPAYLNVLRHLPEPRSVFGVERLIPAGVFYVGLRGRFEGGANRAEVLGNQDTALLQAYTHQGLFDLALRPRLDNRPDIQRGDQFPYWLKKDGTSHARSFCALETAEFRGLLQEQEQLIIQMGREIFDGAVRIDPWKKGTDRACRTCDFASVCRIDPWTQPFRVLADS